MQPSGRPRFVTLEWAGKPADRQLQDPTRLIAAQLTRDDVVEDVEDVEALLRPGIQRSVTRSG